jgi:hypothetical protein
MDCDLSIFLYFEVIDGHNYVPHIQEHPIMNLFEDPFIIDE